MEGATTETETEATETETDKEDKEAETQSEEPSHHHNSTTAAIEHHLILHSHPQNSHDTPKQQHVHLWDPSVTSIPLPQWLQDYFLWHHQQVTTLTQATLPTCKFLIMYAPRGGKSGGMTDRVRPFAVMLRIASETQRVLLIRWERPFPLEEFLLPPLANDLLSRVWATCNGMNFDFA